MVRQKYHQAVVRLQEPLHKKNMDPPVVPPDVSSLELIEALVTMCDAVYELQKLHMDPLLLLDVLDDHDRMINVSLSKRVQERRLGLSLPPSQEDMKLSGLCIELHTHMAIGYKSAIPDLGNGEHQRRAAGQFLRAACGAMAHLKLALLSAYESYRVEPKGIWNAIHRIYARACQLDLQDACPSHADEDRDDLNICRRYKHVLLLGLSNPYQLPFRVIYTVDKALQEWTSQAQLSVSPIPGNNRCRFLIDPNIDRPGIPLLSHRGMDGAAEHWILDTTDVANSLKDEMKLLIDDFATPKRRLDSFNQFAEMEMLRALIGRWNSHRVRGSERKKCSGYCDLAIGMNSVNYVVKGLSSYEVYNELAQINVDDNVIRGSFGGQQAKQRADVRLSDSWQIADISETGFRLVLPSSGQAQVQMNELIAARPRDLSLGWLTGLIQWARYNEDESLEIGARTLSTDARPVSVSVFALADEASRNYTPGLFLPPDDAEDPMIIIPAGLYHPNRVFSVRFEDDEEQTVSVNRLIMSTRAFDWFEIRIQYADRERMLRTILPH